MLALAYYMIGNSINSAHYYTTVVTSEEGGAAGGTSHSRPIVVTD